MRDRKHGAKPKEILWTEERLEEVTQSLIREGLYKPDTVPMIPRLRIPKAALANGERTFDSSFHRDQQAPWDKIFRDEPREKANWLPASYSGFLHDGAAAQLLRRRPNNLRESIARDLIEGSALEHFPTKFRITVFLISRGITEEGAGNKEVLFPNFSWRDFLHYQPKVDRLIRSAKTRYFARNKFIDPAATGTTWTRFDAAWKNLSVKQRSALGIHFMDEEPMSLEAGAKRLKISKAAFRDRVASAVKALEKALPELAAVKSARRSPAAPRKRKAPLSAFAPRPDAPPTEALNAWLEEICIEPSPLEWEIIFRKDRERHLDE